MDNIKVLVINDEGEDIALEEEILKEGLAGKDVEVKYINAGDEASVEAEIKDADGIISVYTKFDKERMDIMGKCRVIATQTIGINTIDLEEATKHGIFVTNVPDYCVDEVAVHTIALALAARRKISVYDRISRDKVWNVEDIYKHGQLNRLRGQYYGIVSFGNIGKKVADMAMAFGMKVMAYDPFVGGQMFHTYGVDKADTLEELFEKCHIVSLHTPLTPKTEGMIDYNLLRRMPEGAVLVNTARGGIVKEDDLVKALNDGSLAMAAVDVIEDEDNFDSELYALKNTIITPHVAYYSEEALNECREKAATMVVDVLTGRETPKYLVNEGVVK